MAHAGEVVDELQRVREAAEERRLVTSAADGSAVAFEQLYRRHCARIHALCLRMTGNVATAEDCTQEAFVQAWRNLRRFETRSAFGTWLHRIAVNAVLQQTRRRAESLGAEDSVEREVADVLADHSTVDPGRSRDLETAIAGLPGSATRAGARGRVRPLARGSLAAARHCGRHLQGPVTPGPRTVERQAWRDGVEP